MAQRNFWRGAGALAVHGRVVSSANALNFSGIDRTAKSHSTECNAASNPAINSTTATTQKAGEVEFKANPLGQVHACVGKVDFPTEVLRENTAAFVRAVLEVRPTRFRGKPPKSITLSTLTGRGVPLDPRLWARKKRF